MKTIFKYLIYISLILFFFIFISLWNLVSDGYDKQNKIILKLKEIIPRNLAVKVRDTLFIIPELKTRNKLLELQVNKYEQGFQGQLFDGSKELLAIADNLKELKTICSMCEKKATMVVRLNQEGEVVLEGEKIVIGGNDIYKTLCRKHFRQLTKLI